MCIIIASVDLKLLLLFVAVMSMLKEVCSASSPEVQRTQVHQAQLRKSLGLAVKGRMDFLGGKIIVSLV